MAKFYDGAPWQRVRRRVLRAHGYTCWRCGNPVSGKGAHVHHRTPVKEDHDLALDDDNLVPLCSRCHAVVHADDKRQGFDRGADLDGSPLSPDHPWNKARQGPQ